MEQTGFNSNIKLSLILQLLLCFAFAGCNGGSLDITNKASVGRLEEPHVELKVIPTEGSNSVSAQAGIGVGSIYLESTLAPMKIGTATAQASDISQKDSNFYIGYSSVDTPTQAIKRGAIEQVGIYVCDNHVTLLNTEYCLKSKASLEFPNADIFATHSDGNFLYAVGSTSDESAAPNFARLYKVSLDANKSPSALLASTTLPSYVGTGVLSLGSTVLATSGTSTESAKMGGLSVVNTSTMAVTASQSLYDARNLAVSPTSSSTVFVTRGKVDSGNAGAIVEYNTTGAGSALRTIASGGNTIPESKSSIQVGNQLLLVSLGNQGFKVICKATGATVATVPAVTVAGIPADRTVTNSVTAAPGYIFAANGEAGLYIYKFSKSSALNTNYCQGVTVNLLGRLGLDSDNSDSTYFSGELSANSVKYIPIIVNEHTVVTSKLIVVASGNKGVALVNISGLNVLTADVDDFK